MSGLKRTTKLSELVEFTLDALNNVLQDESPIVQGDPRVADRLIQAWMKLSFWESDVLGTNRQAFEHVPVIFSPILVEIESHLTTINAFITTMNDMDQSEERRWPYDLPFFPRYHMIVTN